MFDSRTGSVGVSARSNVAPLLLGSHIFSFFPPPGHPSLSRRRTRLSACRVVRNLSPGPSRPPNTPSFAGTRNIRDTWLTIDRESVPRAHGGALLIFPLKLTCLRDVCFQGGPSHVPESLKSDTGAYRQWHPAEGCTRYPCSSDRRSTYVCYRYVVHLPFAYYFSGRTCMPQKKKRENDPRYLFVSLL